MKRWFLRVVVILFIGLAIFTWWPRDPVGPVSIPDFQKQLASNLKDWTWVDRPVAESEEIVNAIEKQLAFDDGLYRVYTNDQIAVAVWAAYWSPGKADIVDVHTHEPDSCWVHGGWEIAERTELYDFRFPDGKQLVPAKYRLMSKPTGQVHVAFWHLVGGVNLKIDRNEGSLTKYPKIIQQTGMQNRAEQYFIRISSTHAFEDLMGDSGFRKILESLAQFGLYE